MTSTTNNIVALALKHGASSYCNRADTQNPAYGFTETALAAFAQELLAGQCLHQIAEPAADGWKDHHTAQLVNDLRDCAATYGQAQQLRERMAGIVRPLCDQLQHALGGLQPAAPAISDDDRQTLIAAAGVLLGHGYTASSEALQRLLGVPAEALAGQAAAPAHPAEGAPAGEREAFEQIVKETMHGAGEDHIAERLACWPDGTYKDRSTGYAWWAWQRRAALAATPAAPAARGMQVLVSSGALQMVINALRRDAEYGKTARGEMADELLATAAPAAPAADALTHEELLGLRRAADDFLDGCDTDVDHDLLARGAIAGYLFCDRFSVLDSEALDAAIDAARAAQGGA